MLQQPQYWRQFARVWLGRTWAKTEVKEKSPHIFVIGHTHNPKLSYIDLFLTLELPALKAPGE
jgi:hypothetical protein